VDYANQLFIRCKREIAVTNRMRKNTRKNISSHRINQFQSSLLWRIRHVSIVIFLNNGWNLGMEPTPHRVIGFGEWDCRLSDERFTRRPAWALSFGRRTLTLGLFFFCRKEDGSGYNEAPGGEVLHFRSQIKKYIELSFAEFGRNFSANGPFMASRNVSHSLHEVQEDI